MQGFDYSVLKENKIYDRLRPLGKFLTQMKYKIEYAGAENIPKDGGFILASNHLCSLDPVFIAVGMNDRQLHFMGKKELFEKRIPKYFLTMLNGFPIVRGGADSEAMRYAFRIVEEGYVLGIFPEGTRSKDFKPGKAKSGVAVIANKTKRGVLPTSVYSSDQMKNHTRLTIRYGKLIPYEELGISDGASKEELRECAERIMEEIKKLWSLGHCG